MSPALEVAVRIVCGAVGLFVAVAVFLSAVKTVVVPRGGSLRITRALFWASGKLFNKWAHNRRAYEDRDRILAVYAPLTFVLLPILWVILTIFAFGLMQYAASGASVRDAFLISGSSMLTLGVLFNKGGGAPLLSFAQATIGLILVAMLISYLPTIYSAYSKRESLVGLLESRAGIPPSALEMLNRYHRIQALDLLDSDLFNRWEDWFIEIEESHTSFAALVFFRSPLPERSWVTASGCVLDTAALYLSVLDRPWSPRAALCLRTGFLSLGRIAEQFGIPRTIEPGPDVPISIHRFEFDELVDQLVRSGLPVKADRELAWTDFRGWRVNYDRALISLADITVAPQAVWSSDRVMVSIKNG